MMRNAMFLIAMSLGVTAAFLSDTRFFIAGAVVALTTMFMRFKNTEPLIPKEPKVPTDPVDVLEMELTNLNDEMSNFSIDDDTKESYLKLAENRDKISMALVELAKSRMK